MANSNLLPGYGIVQEIDSKQNLLPGYGIVFETIVAASGSLIKTWNGIAIASVKTINGIPIASVKSINGIANV